MPHYNEERKAAVLSKLLPPHKRPVSEIAKTEGTSEATLYNWLKQARQQGVPVPGSISNSPEDWSGEAKFAMVIETAPLNAGELSEYCRAKEFTRNKSTAGGKPASKAQPPNRCATKRSPAN